MNPPSLLFMLQDPKASFAEPRFQWGSSQQSKGAVFCSVQGALEAQQATSAVSRITNPCVKASIWQAVNNSPQKYVVHYTGCNYKHSSMWTLSGLCPASLSTPRTSNFLVLTVRLKYFQSGIISAKHWCQLALTFRWRDPTNGTEVRAAFPCTSLWSCLFLHSPWKATGVCCASEKALKRDPQHPHF